MDKLSGPLISWLLLKIAVALIALCCPAEALRGCLIESGDSVEHPFLEPGELKTGTCLSCHPGKKQGKFVHPALVQGCDGCHRAVAQNRKTTITLVTRGGELCSRCHDFKPYSVMHGPFKEGHCTICHDPHASDFPGVTRAEANTLCMSCHVAGQPDVQINAAGKTVALLGGQTLDLEAYDQAGKIRLDPGGSSGHPITNHPIAGRDPQKSNGTLNCLSCHVPHGSASKSLLLPRVKTVRELCALCHR